MRWPWQKKTEDRQERRQLPAPDPQRHSSSGVRWRNGRPYSSEIEDSDAHRWAVRACRMLASDPKIAQASSRLRSAIESARWTVVPGGESEAAIRNAEYIRGALGLDGYSPRLLRGDWREQVRRMSGFAAIGYAVLEEIYYRASDGAVYLAELADIDPASVRDWVRDEGTGEIVGMRQRIDWGDAATDHYLPAHKGVVVTHGRVGDALEGVGILRRCAPWVDAKARLLEALTDGTDRWAIPVPIVRVDRAALESGGYTDDEQQTLIATAQDAAAAFAAGDVDYLTAPAGVDAEIYGGGTYSPAPVLAAIEHCNEEIAAAWDSTAQELGLSRSGARSVGEIHQEAWRALVVSCLDEIESAINGADRPFGGLVYRLIAVNFYNGASIPGDELPQVVHRGVEVDAIRDALGVLPSLVAGGLLTPDDQIERRVREVLGIAAPAPARSWQERRASVGSVGSTSDLRASEGGRPRQDEITPSSYDAEKGE